jgi:hypothetical protein
MSNAKDAPARVSPLAGKPATPAMLVDVPRLVTAYYTGIPDSSVPAQRVAFGTSGHRGSAFENTFNEWHVLAISQAICDYRKQRGIDGPLFLGIDTHALSVPACASALEVLAANGVDVMLADIRERKYWKHYMKAYEACMTATSTRHAPWYIVPADDKENSRLIVSRIILDTLEALKMTYPKSSAKRRRELQSIRKQLAK